MTPRDTVSPWRVHAAALAAVALAATAACGAYVLVRADGPPMAVVFGAGAVGLAIYALLASVFVAFLGPTATRRRVVLANAAAAVLAPIAAASVLTMRPVKPAAAPPPAAPPHAAPPASRP